MKRRKIDVNWTPTISVKKKYKMKTIYISHIGLWEEALSVCPLYMMLGKKWCIATKEFFYVAFQI